MGYDTQYDLELRNPFTGKILDYENLIELVVKDLRDTCEEAKYSLDSHGKRTCDECRWYKHEDDLRKFSKRYSSFLFVLHGEGESPGDIWRKYFLNGQCQEARAVVQIAAFDRDKLK